MQQKIFEGRKVLLSFPTVNGTMLLGTLICLMGKKAKVTGTLMNAEWLYYMNLNNSNMRTSGWCIVISFLAVVLFANCKDADNRLFVAERNGLYGYINAQGDTIVDCTFPFAYTDTISRIGFVADSAGAIKCFNNKGEFLFKVFNYDNGPDYPADGLFRIVDDNALVGFADTLGNIVISPRFKFAYPFKEGHAKVTDTGVLVPCGEGVDRHTTWLSDKWYFISKKKR